MLARYLILTGLLTLLLFSCKKDPKKTTTTSSTSNGLSSNNILQANINGVTWQTPSDGFSTSKSGSIHFSGQTSLGTPYSSLSFVMPLTTTTGVATFGGTSTVTATFKDTLGINYVAKTGTINITLLDTFKYGVKKMKANFSFLSDTVGGKTYNVQGGVIDFKI